MRLRLTDFQSNTREGVEGTCERCMRTGMLNYPTYTFADSGGGVHVVEGWYSDWGDHIVIDVNLPVFTHWLHSVEFKQPKGVAELSDIDDLSGERLWEEYLFQVLESAAYCDTEQELNKNLAWALLGSQSTN